MLLLLTTPAACRNAHDHESAALLRDVIYPEEITHVAAGVRWLRHLHALAHASTPPVSTRERGAAAEALSSTPGDPVSQSGPASPLCDTACPHDVHTAGAYTAGVPTAGVSAHSSAPGAAAVPGSVTGRHGADQGSRSAATTDPCSSQQDMASGETAEPGGSKAACKTLSAAMAATSVQPVGSDDTVPVQAQLGGTAEAAATPGSCGEPQTDWLQQARKHERVELWFHQLTRLYFKGNLKPPFNSVARAQAGFSEEWYLPMAEKVWRAPAVCP